MIIEYNTVDLAGRRKELFYRILGGVKNSSCSKQCWEWSKGNSGNGRGGGYGRISVDGQMMAVHRVMWMIWHGPIPHRRQIDHICRNRSCCNPYHLESVTHKENQKRRDNPPPLTLETAFTILMEEQKFPLIYMPERFPESDRSLRD